MIRAYTTSALVVLLLTCPPLSGQQNPATRIARASRDAVVHIAAFDADSSEIRTGSGFFIADDGTLITNYHVIEDASFVQIKLATGARYGEVEYLGALPERDLVALRVVGVTPITLGVNPIVPPVGDRVYVVGSPLGLEGSFSEGIVSGIREIAGVRLIQFTAPISPGSSGGPLLDSNGKVIGVATATYTKGQNLNLAIPSANFLGLLSSGAFQRLTRSLVPPRSTPRKASKWYAPGSPEGIYDYFSGKNGETGVRREGVMVLMPTSVGHVLFGYWKDPAFTGEYTAVDDPVTILPDGRVYGHIQEPLEGGFVNDSTFGLAPPDREPRAYDMWTFSRSGLEEDLPHPTGLFQMSGSRGSYDLEGVAAIVYTEFRERSSEARLCMVRIVMKDERAYSLDFSTTAKVYNDGRISLEPTAMGNQKISGRGTLRAGQLALTVYRQITNAYYVEYSLAGRKEYPAP